MRTDRKRRRRVRGQDAPPVTREEFDALIEKVSMIEQRALYGRQLIPVALGGAAGTDDGYAITTGLAPGVPVVTSDGNAPDSSPDPTVLPGINCLVVKWPAITNADPVTYEVHISETPAFTPDSTTKAAETDGTLIFLRNLSNDGGSLVYDQTYYVQIVAKDEDGSAAASAEASAAPRQVEGEDIVLEGITAEHILADQALFEKLNTVLLISNTMKTAESGQRVEIDANGVRLLDSSNNPIVELPTDGANPALFYGNVITGGLTVTGGMTIQGNDNALDDAAALILSAQQHNPGTAPSVSVDMAENALSGFTTVTTPPSGAIFYDPAGDSDGLTNTWLVGRREMLEEFDATTGALIRSFDLNGIDIFPGFYTNGPNIRGITRIGSYIYVLCIDNIGNYYSEGGDSWNVWIHKIDQATFTHDSFEIINGDLPAWDSDLNNQNYDATATLTNDGTNLIVVAPNGTGTTARIQLLYYDPASLSTAPQSFFADDTTRTYTRSSGQPDPRIVGAHVDLANNELWVMVREDGTLGNVVDKYDITQGASYPSTMSFVYNSADADNFRDTQIHRGLTHDGNYFYGLRVAGSYPDAGVPSIVGFTDWDAGGLGTDYFVAYLWADASENETLVSPEASISVGNRQRLKITTPEIPGSVDHFHVYVGTVSGTLKRQVAPTYIDDEAARPAYMHAFNSGGAAPPGANGWPGGDSSIESAAGEWELHGDGSVLGLVQFDDGAVARLEVVPITHNVNGGAAISAHSGGSDTHTVTGVAVGDICWIAGYHDGTNYLWIRPDVTATDTVTFRFFNSDSVSRTPGNTNFDLVILHLS